MVAAMSRRPPHWPPSAPPRAARELWLIGFALLMIMTASACDTQADRPASFAYLQATIIGPNCATASCHSASDSAEDLDFTDVDASYLSLTGVACGDTKPSLYVNTGDPSRSAILSIMRSTGGDRMPPDIGVPEEEIALIARWISEGAKCD